MSEAADDEIVSWRERRVHACELFCRSERDSYARGHRSVPIENSLQQIAEDPEVTEGEDDRHIQEGELDARLLAPCTPALVVVFVNWCASTSRALALELVCTSARHHVRVRGC